MSKELTPLVEGEAICGAEAEKCVCTRTDCDGDHHCDCGGGWRGDIDSDSFEILSFPSTFVGPFGGTS